MDLFNNAQGISLGASNPNLSVDELASLVCVEVSSGAMLIINESDTSELVDSNECGCQQ